jgi:hypothetical protein
MRWTIRLALAALAAPLAAWIGAALAIAGFAAPLRVDVRTPTRSAPWPAASAVPRFSHVFLIVMENRAAASIYGGGADPYLHALARRYSVATAFYAVAHPSLPNYLALLGGSTFGVTSDCSACYVRAPNLVDRLEGAHKSWGAYMEGLPAVGWLGAAWWPGLYVGKHDPFRYFLDIRQSAARRQHIRPLSALWPALAHAHVPDFVWITPNVCHDMHSCPTAVGDAWLRLIVPRILASTAWRDGGVLFITWDEAVGMTPPGPGRGGRVALLAISPMSVPGGRLGRPADDANLLATIEDALGVGCVGASCGAAPLGAGLFQR